MKLQSKRNLLKFSLSCTLFEAIIEYLKSTFVLSYFPKTTVSLEKIYIVVYKDHNKKTFYQMHEVMKTSFGFSIVRIKSLRFFCAQLVENSQVGFHWAFPTI